MYVNDAWVKLFNYGYCTNDFKWNKVEAKQQKKDRKLRYNSYIINYQVKLYSNCLLKINWLFCHTSMDRGTVQKTCQTVFGERKPFFSYSGILKHETAK